MKLGKRGWTVLAVVAIAIASALVASATLALQRLQNEPLLASGEAVTIRVPSGTPFFQVTHELAARGLIPGPYLLSGYARLTGQAQRVKAGEYAIEPGMSAIDLLRSMVRGDVVRYQLTIIEGWTFAEMMDAIRAHPALKHTLGDAAPGEIMARLGEPGQHPEGWFLPETYQFTRGMTDLAFLRRAHRAMEEVLAAEWAEREDGLPLESSYQALILASIIEKETAKPDERPRIAGVFVRRLEMGMRLQTDPTVIYGLGEDFDGNLRYADLRRDTPYNTYTRAGLPPTPIALPGRAAIHAALHPTEGDALYFVARGDGSHVFSATLKAHNRAVRKHQLGD